MIISLARRKFLLNQDIDFLAGEARARHMTDTRGQQAVYTEKLKQARQYIQQYPNMAPPPYIQMEADAINMDPYALATNIIVKGEAWEGNTGPLIESLRIKGKRDIASASNEAEALAVHANIRQLLNDI